MRRHPLVIPVILTVLALLLGGCGGGGGGDTTSEPDDVPSSAGETAPVPSEPPVSTANATILGEPTAFTAGAAGAEDLSVSINGRECVLAELLPITCRASTGAGGSFVVTAESAIDAPTEFTMVVRCGLDPAIPAASGSGGQPVTSDLGLAPYGEVAGITLIGPDSAEAALVYQPEGEDCPVVWGLGEVDPTSFFTGGTDALNGEESPIFYKDGTGADACAFADGQGGITVSSAEGGKCS